jgi:cytochrome c5
VRQGQRHRVDRIHHIVVDQPVFLPQHDAGTVRRAVHGAVAVHRRRGFDLACAFDRHHRGGRQQHALDRAPAARRPWAPGPSGETVYNQTCQVCHGAGVAGAPKLGDKADWGPRVAQGKDTLYQHAIAGFTGKKGAMPPKGGNTALPDADVKAAVDFMVSKAN